MARGATAIVGDLGDLFTVTIDPTWPYLGLWDGGDIGDVLRVTFFDFEAGISEGSSVNYAGQDVVGRAEQIMSYTGTGSRELPMVFQFRAQGMVGGDAGKRVGGSNLTLWQDIKDAVRVNGDGEQARDRTAGIEGILEREVKQPALWLDALKYPVVDEGTGLSHAPPPVLISIGRLLKMRAVATSVQVSWVGPFDPDTLMPHGATVAVTFTAVSGFAGRHSMRGTSRWKPSSGALDGVDGPANPSSSLGAGRSGTTASTDSSRMA